MKKTLFIALLLTSFLGIGFSSCTDDDPNVSARKLNEVSYENVIDSISSSIQFLDTTYLSKLNTVFCYEFKKDGNLYEYAVTDSIYDGSEEPQILVDTIRMTWNLEKKPVAVQDDIAYYNINVVYKQSDNNGPFNFIKSVSLTTGAKEAKGTLYLSVDEAGSVNLYMSDQATTKGLAEFIANLGISLWKRITKEDVPRAEGRTDLADWMSNIKTDVPICKLSIPGTHDTFTYLCRLSSLMAKTQEFNIEKQWNLGIRSFDFRVDNFTISGAIDYASGDDAYKGLQLTHGGFVSLGINLPDAFKKLTTLLKAHSTETAIVVLKYDLTIETLNEEIRNRLLDGYIKEHKEDFVAWTPDITLEKAKGKIILVTRYMSTVAGTARATNYIADDGIGEKSLWGDNRKDNILVDGVHGDKYSKLDSLNKVAKLLVQDVCEQKKGEQPSAFFTRKKAALKANLDELNKEEYADKYVWAFNHTSGYITTINVDGSNEMSSMNYPWNSSVMNPYTEGLLKNEYKNAYTGVVVVDWAGLTDDVAGGLSGVPFNTSCQTLPETIVKHNNNITWKGAKVTKKDIQ